MHLFVRHETHYDYDGPVTYAVQRLILTPPDFASQHVVRWAITAPGIENALSYTDGFGNIIHLVTARNASGPVTIAAEGVVKVEDAAGVVKGVRQNAPDQVFLRQTRASAPSPEMAEMARDVTQGLSSELERLHRLMAAIHGHVAYETGVTHAHTTAAEAFAEAQGVCQDHAHVFIGMARRLGVPARYVTGYLITGEGASSTAAHAWAEALVPGLGWVGFDPANGKCPTDHYVRLAAGIDASGVAPIRGSRRGGAGERMSVAVRVEQHEQQ